MYSVRQFRKKIISTVYGAGFLPTFGPCFVNFYGAPREYSEMPTEYDNLNKGRVSHYFISGRFLYLLSLISA